MKIESKISFTAFLILLLGGIGFCVLSYNIISNAFYSDYPQVDDLIIGLSFGIIGSLCMLSVWSLKKYEFDGEKLVIKSILNTTKKIIYLRDIIGYNEIEKENKYVQWTDLTIFTKKTKEKISSSTVSNYNLLKTELTKNIERDFNSETNWSYRVQRRYGIGFVLTAILFLIASLYTYSNKDVIIKPTDLTTITATISENPKIEKGRSSRTINLKLKEYPKYKFKISGVRFEIAESYAIISELNVNDKIEVDILTDTFEKKVSKKKPLTFLEKSINYSQIKVNGLRRNEKIYLRLDDINYKETKSSKSEFLIFLIIGMANLFIGFYLLKTG